MLHIPTLAERDYLAACGLVAVYVAAAPKGEPCLIGHTFNLAKEARRLARRDMGLTWIGWVASEEAAAAIVRAARSAPASHRRGRALDLTGEEAIFRLRCAAGQAGLSIAEHGAVMLRVSRSIETVEAAISKAARRGDLAWFNGAYAKARNIRSGRRLTWGQASRALRLAIYRRVLRGAVTLLDNSLLNEIGLDH